MNMTEKETPWSMESKENCPKSTGGWTYTVLLCGQKHLYVHISKYYVDSPSANHLPSSHTTPLSPHRRPSQSRASLVLDPHISGALGRGKQQDLPRAGGGGGRVESFIAGAGDDHYLVVLAQVNTPRVQQRLEVGQQILRCLPRYQSL